MMPIPWRGATHPILRLSKDTYPTYLENTERSNWEGVMLRMYELDAYFSLRRVELGQKQESKVRRETRALLQILLRHIAGQQFPSFDQNRIFTRELTALMNRLQVRIACPRPGCGEPARIRVKAVIRTRYGAFQFEHLINDRLITHFTGVSIPGHIKLVTAPADRRTTRWLQA